MPKYDYKRVAFGFMLGALYLIALQCAFAAVPLVLLLTFTNLGWFSAALFGFVIGNGIIRIVDLFEEYRKHAKRRK